MEHEGDSSYFNADSGASIASFLTEYLPDELSSDADALPAIVRRVWLNPFDLTSAGEAVGKVDWG